MTVLVKQEVTKGSDPKKQVTSAQSELARMLDNQRSGGMRHLEVLTVMNSPAFSTKRYFCINCPNYSSESYSAFQYHRCVGIQKLQSFQNDALETSYCHRCRICDKFIKTDSLESHFRNDHADRVNGVVDYFEQQIMGLKGPKSSAPLVDKDAIENKFAECTKEPGSVDFKNEDIKQETASPNFTKAKKKRKNKRDLDKSSDIDVKKIKKEPLTDPEMPEGSAIQEHGIYSNKLKIKLKHRKRQVKSSEGLTETERENCLGGNGENGLGMHFLANMDLTDRDEAEETHDGMAAVESTKSCGKRKYKKSNKTTNLVSEPHSSPEPLTQNEMDQSKDTVDIKPQLPEMESFMAPFPKNSMKYVAVRSAMNSPALSEKQDTCIGCPEGRCSATGNFAESTCILWRSKGSDHWDRSYCHKCRLCNKYVKQADLDTHFTSQHSEVGCVVGYFEQVIEKEWRTNAEKWIECQQGEVHRCKLCKTSVNQTSEEISEHLDFSHYGVSLGYYYKMYFNDALSSSVSKTTAKCDLVDSKSKDLSPQNPPLADQVNSEVPLQSHIPCSTEPLTAITEVIWSPANEKDWFWQNSQSYIPHEPEEGKTKNEKRVNDVHDTNFVIPKNWPSMYSFKNGKYSAKQLLSAKKFHPSQRKHYFRSVGLTKEESEFILKKIAREESNESKEVEIIDEEESEFGQEGFVPGAANCTDKNSYYGPNYANLYCDPRERLQEVEMAKPKKAYRHSLTKDKLKESKYNSETPIDANQSFHGSIPELTNVWVNCDNTALIEASDFNASDSGIGSPGSDYFSGLPVDPNESLTTDKAMMNQGLTENQSHSEKPEENFVEEFELDLPAANIEHVNSYKRVVSEDKLDPDWLLKVFHQSAVGVLKGNTASKMEHSILKSNES